MNLNHLVKQILGSTTLVSCLALWMSIALCAPVAAEAQTQQIAWSKQEKLILEDIRDLRNLSEGNRAKTTKQLALKIRQLPAGLNKIRLAVTLASLSTEGDAGKDTLQEVATTLLTRFANNRFRRVRRGPTCPTPNWRNWCITNLSR